MRGNDVCCQLNCGHPLAALTRAVRHWTARRSVRPDNVNRIFQPGAVPYRGTIMSTATLPRQTSAFGGRAPAYAGVPWHQKAVKTRLPAEFRSGAAGGEGESEPLATFLGWFSVGLGLWEVLAPRSVANATGVRYHPALIQAYGLRELAAGLGILTTRRPAGWLAARVAGDALDLGTLGAAYAQANADDRRKICQAAAAVAGVTVLDVVAARNHCQAED